MQPMRRLTNWLADNTNAEFCLFTPNNLRALCPGLSDNAFRTLLTRTVQAGHLERICRGMYRYRRSPLNGLELFQCAAMLRANAFNYISLETALSDAGVISQIPLQWITLMSSGRSTTISCGRFGTIEFIHTSKKPTQVIDQLTYDSRCGLWRASVPLALKDMKDTHRDTDLIDWSVADEYI
ncbi:MAG: hypothetical protein V4490_06480 [Pseudomonadota bacterium]